MTEKFSEFNPLDYLHTDKEIADYLSECYRDEDPQTFVIALGHIAKKKGIASIAKKTGLSRESLYKTFSVDGRVQPKWDTVTRVLKALQLPVTLKVA